jgi:hypothetical protein
MKATGKAAAGAPEITTYCERQIGKTLYRVSGVFKGEVELKKALEALAVRKITEAT